MRVVVQRVSEASVTVDGEVVGRIAGGLLVLVGFTTGDGGTQIEWMVEKLLGLRIFPDDEGRMNRNLEQVGGSLLIVSQFTLYGDVQRGRRPSFVGAAPPELAERLYNDFVEELRKRHGELATGVFGAMMEVALVNDGPVTLVIDR